MPGSPIPGYFFTINCGEKHSAKHWYLPSMECRLSVFLQQKMMALACLQDSRWPVATWIAGSGLLLSSVGGAKMWVSMDEGAPYDP